LAGPRERIDERRLVDLRLKIEFPMFHRFWPIWIVLLAAPLAGCGGGASATPPSSEPVKVELGRPTQKEVTDYQDFTGRLDAVANVEIRSRVSGYLTKIAFDSNIEHGAEVKEGDLLFEIDQRPFEIALQSAEAELLQAQAKLKTSTSELDRTQRLFDKGASTQADLDRDVGGKMSAEASIQSGNAAVAQAKLDLVFSKITAPISGRISRNLVSIGDLISPATGKLTTIVSVETIYAYFDMDELTMQRLQAAIRDGKLKGPTEGKIPVMLGLGPGTEYTFTGVLDFIENQVDPNTGTIRVRGVFDNPKSEKGPRPLAPGYFARIRLPLGEPHKAVLVPERAIGRDLGTPFIYAVDGEDKVVFRRVTLGALQEGQRVVLEGVSAEDRIVVNGLQRVRAGIKVVDAKSSPPSQ
jgi:RND family efflux transporter MFP subunit